MAFRARCLERQNKQLERRNRAAGTFEAGEERALAEKPVCFSRAYHSSLICTLGSLSLALAACTGGAKQAPQAPIGVSDEVELTEYEDDEETSAEPPEDVVLAAAKPFIGFRPADDRSFTEESVLTHLAAADVICIGEQHDDPVDHYAQLRAIEGLLDRRAMRGFELGVGLEMVRTRYQGVLSNVDREAILGDGFTQAVSWEQEWGFPIQYYRPQLLWAKEGGADLVALGVDRALTRAVAKQGLDALEPSQQNALPDLDLDVAAHRQLFERLMKGHPSGGEAPNLDNYYAAQVVWDEAMAQESVEWLAARAPAGKLLILAGVGHCHQTAIPGRIERRGDFAAVSVLPMNEPEEYEDRQDLAAAYDYHLIFHGGT